MVSMARRGETMGVEGRGNQLSGSRNNQEAIRPSYIAVPLQVSALALSILAVSLACNTITAFIVNNFTRV